MKPTVRATRAYLAGLGTSGSLLAGAALLFVLGSAIVAFRGWPQISTGPASVVVAAAHPAAQPSPVSRRLATALRRQRATGGAGLTPAAARRAVRAHKSHIRATTRTRSPVASAPSGAPAAPSGSSASAVSAGGPSAPPCGNTCHRPSPTGLVSQLTSTVSQEVSNVGSSVSSGVSSATSGVAGSLNGVSPQAGKAVQNLGSAAGNTIAGTSTTAANTLNQVGSALSGGH